MASGFRILVVDDNADMRESMKMLLEREGYEVELAENGAHALDMQRRQDAHVVITDLLMPEADGLETIERLRREFPGVKIIAMSGGGARVRGEDYLPTAVVAGADAILAKPFDKGALMSAVRSVLPAA